LKKPYNKQFLISELLRVYSFLGRTPKTTELKQHGLPSKDVFQKNFGNFYTACIEAGIPAPRTKRGVTDEELLNILREIYKQKNAPITNEDLGLCKGLPDPSTYQKRFGGVNKAASLAGVPSVSHYNFSDEELLSKLKDLYEKLGKTPSREDLEEHNLPTDATYRARFGSLTTAYKHIGVVSKGRWEESDEELLNMLKDLFLELGRPPHSSELPKYGLPTDVTYRNRFGSYTEALLKCGVTDVIHSTGSYRGIKCLAEDGTVCLSFAELLITNFLIENGIAYEKEPHYPNSKYRADWKVGDVFIEYFGLKGKSRYDDKIIKKRAICNDYGISLLEIYPKNLNDLNSIFQSIMTA
jgi:hypothetical protein